MKNVLIPTLLALALSTAFGQELSKKEQRQARKAAAEAKQTEEAIESMGPLPEKANALYPEIDRTLRLTDAQIRVTAAAIDSLVDQGLEKVGGQRNPRSSDEIFVRRIFLDIAGRVPTPNEMEAFLENESPHKRARLIDALLISDGYRSHQFNWLADMLRQKSGIKRANYALYMRWLKDGLRENRGWDKTVYEMMTAEGSLATTGASGYLLRDFGMPLDSLSNTLTLFLGANVSCAQCHDHPLAEWTQKEFYEMASFFGATDVSSRDPRKVGNAIKDDKISKQDVMAVVAQNMYRVKTLDANHLVYPEDYAYDDAKPGETVEPFLVSWGEDDHLGAPYQVDLENPENFRKSFATWLTHPENPRFAAAIANRLWKKMFGIAVQEPIEDLDDLQQASNPELLKHLAKIMAEHEFDLREFQRIVFNTATYQAEASSTPPIGDIDEYPFPGPVLRRMTAEQAWDSVLTISYGPEIDALQTDRSHMATRFAFDFDGATNAMIYHRTIESKMNGYMAKDKLSDEDMMNGQKRPETIGNNVWVMRASELPTQPERDKHFLRAFGQSSRELADDGSLEGNIPQMLMLMNGRFQSLLSDPDSRLMREVLRRKNKGPAIDTLYATFYSRQPTKEERGKIKAAMEAGTTLEDLTWTLFNTPEFLFVQ